MYHLSSCAEENELHKETEYREFLSETAPYEGQILQKMVSQIDKDHEIDRRMLYFLLGIHVNIHDNFEEKVPLKSKS